MRREWHRGPSTHAAVQLRRRVTWSARFHGHARNRMRSRKRRRGEVPRVPSMAREILGQAGPSQSTHFAVGGIVIADDEQTHGSIQACKNQASHSRTVVAGGSRTVAEAPQGFEAFSLNI